MDVFAASASKKYDGNANFSDVALKLTGVETGDTVTATASGYTDDANVRSGKTFNKTSVALDGTHKDYYSLDKNSVSGTVDITPKTLTITGLTATDRVYDGTTDVQLTGGTLEGIVGTDDVTATFTGAVADKNVGNNKTVSLSTLAEGADAYNYTFTMSGPVTVDITAKALTIDGLTATNRAYDGTREVALTGGTLNGAIAGDDVTTIMPTIGTVATADAGNGKAVTATLNALTGNDAGNYTLAAPTNITVNITKSQPTVAFKDYTPGRAYNGTALTNPTAAQLTVTGASYENVIFTWYKGSVAEANKLSSAPKDAGSYVLTANIPETTNTAKAEVTLTVTISPKAVTADSTNITLTPSEYEFDGTERRPAVVIKDGGLTIPASEYEVSYSGNVNVGTATVTITDNPDGNYSVNGSTTFQITKVHQTALSITQKPASIKYGDTFTLGIEGGSGEGTVTWSVTGPATVSATGEVKITGVGSVTVKAVKAGGNDYEDAEATLTFEAAKKPVTAVVTAANKTYDGSTSAAVTAEVTTGLMDGDMMLYK